jgi:hypothetical protein
MHTENLVKNLKNTLRSLPIAVFVVLGTPAWEQTPIATGLERIMSQSLRTENNSAIYFAGEVMLRARVGGGVVDLGDNEPVTEILLPEGLTVSQALTHVLSFQDRYFWREVNGLVNILPQNGIPPLLDTKIALFKWRSNATAWGVVEALGQSPEFVGRRSQLGYVDGLHYGPGLQAAPPVYSTKGPAPVEAPKVFERRDIALIDLLNQIAMTYSPPAIWRYSEYSQGRARAVTISAH